MLKPITYIPEGVYWSNNDGSPCTYYFDILQARLTGAWSPIGSHGCSPGSRGRAR